MKKRLKIGVFFPREMRYQIVVPMEIGVPTYSAVGQLYTFPIQSSPLELSSAPKYIEGIDFPDAPDLRQEEVQIHLENFVSQFIEKTKRYFSTPLRSKTILSRLSHVWEGLPTTREASVSNGWYTVSWRPSSLKIIPKEFVLVWKCGSLESAEPVIPNDFINEAESRSPSPAPEVRTIQLQQSTSSGNSLIELDPSFMDVNDSRMMMTLDYEAPAHTLEKKKIREAKLRAALASLKAERLAEKYYQKYGSLPGGDSSDLSSESENEDS
jgi:hypothetical protein